MTDPNDAHGDKRTSVLIGDRLCTGCGYNLVGQYVVRETHYALLIVRCPECGTAASVQEYPLLGRWANRIGVVLAVMWFLALFAAWPASSGLLCAMSIGVGEQAARPYADYLRDRHQEDMATARREAAETDEAEAPAPVTPAAPPSPMTTVLPGGSRVVVTTPAQVQRAGPPIAIDEFNVWWTGQDPAALLADAGGWRKMISWQAAMLLVPTAIGAFALGCFWTVVLVQLRRRWVLLWIGVVLLLATAFLSIGMIDWLDPMPMWYYRAARGQMSPPAAFGTIAWSGVALVIGAFAGRPIARGLARLLLPPTLRNALSILWTADGKPLPAGGRALRAQPASASAGSGSGDASS